MSGQRHTINALIQVDPSKAKAQILAALKQTGVHKGDAAAQLGCSHGTLLRWIAELGLSVEVEAMAERAAREGWHHGKNRQSPGRPKGVKDSVPRTRRSSGAGPVKAAPKATPKPASKRQARRVNPG